MASKRDAAQTALSRRAKRRVYGPPHTAYIDAAGGVKDPVREELRRVLGDPIAPVSREAALDNPRGLVVLRDADYRGLLELCLRAQLASDIRMIIHQAPVERVPQLEAALKEAPIDLFVAGGQSVRLTIDSTASTVYHEGLIRDACSRAFSAAGVEILESSGRHTTSSAATDPAESHHKIAVSILHDTLRVSISLVGEPLWKRGYRATTAAIAPLREDLAAVGIDASLQPGEHPFLFVPFAGSATFACETAIRVYGLSSGFWERDFAFAAFPFGAPKSVSYVLEQLAIRARAAVNASGPLEALLIDRHKPAVEAARANLASFARGLEAWRIPDVLNTRLVVDDAFSSPWSELVPSGGAVYLPLNPPYGLRLETSDVDRLYSKIGREIQELAGHCTLSGCCLCPSVSTWRIVRDAASDAGLTVSTLHVGHGGLDVRLLSFRGA